MIALADPEGGTGQAVEKPIHGSLHQLLEDVPPEEGGGDEGTGVYETRLTFRYEGEGRDISLELEGVTEDAIDRFVDLVDSIVSARNP